MKRARGQHGRCHPWTANQVALLVREWGELGARSLVAKLRPHTWTAVRQKAIALRLPLGVPQGRATANQLSKLLGIDRGSVGPLMEQLGVAARNAYPGRAGAKRCQRKHYNIAEAVDAFRAHEALESSADAARRLHANRSTLRLRAIRAGLLTGPRAKLTPEQWNALAAVPRYTPIARVLFAITREAA
jgi:hypothetical protein